MEIETVPKTKLLWFGSPHWAARHTGAHITQLIGDLDSLTSDAASIHMCKTYMH
jgi:hypothetical protein